MSLVTAWELDRIRRDNVKKRLLLNALHVNNFKLTHRGYEHELVLIHLVNNITGGITGHMTGISRPKILLPGNCYSTYL